MKDRRIHFEGISNARDLGGLISDDGRIVRSGLLIRSANLSHATASDTALLRERYDLHLTIDLRTPMAERKKPDVRIEGVDQRRIPIFEDAMIGVTHEDDRDYARRKTMMPKMTDLYRMMVRDPFCRKRFGQVLMLIMTMKKGSALWHCSEGKDRCGLTTVFLLTALGVTQDQILEDYMMTNEVALARGDMYYQLVMENVGDEQIAASVRDAFIVKEEYLMSALEEITRAYGSVMQYILQGLEIPKEVTDGFRGKMLK